MASACMREFLLAFEKGSIKKENITEALLQMEKLIEGEFSVQKRKRLCQPQVLRTIAGVFLTPTELEEICLEQRLTERVVF